ncbi:MAG: leucine-rich repeat domain-containing protein, partial [Lentisphaeria bacterium]|nr:leucine-rich repeat domain-containing protein [Lentisphaeria bacterium]
MTAGKLFLIGLCVSFLLSPALSGQDSPVAPEPEKKIKARIAAAEKSKIVLSDDGRTVIGIMEQERKMYTIPKGVTVIGPKAFAGCVEMRKITLPDTLETIEAEAFKGCIGLKNITIPKGVKKIGREAFLGCKFKKVVIPEGVETISSSAFYGCTELERVTLPSTLVEIKGAAFRGCPKLKVVTLPASLENLASDAFHGTTIRVAPKNPNFYSDERGVLFHKPEKMLVVAPVTLPKRYTIPADITSIEKAAFQGCEEMKCVTVHAGVLKIGDGAFAGVEKVERDIVSPEVTVYCAAESKPDGWSDEW